ncbi:hypothetical protein, partial [Enterobacter hormaechei]|uniref:hypothetical protein n=1 Tax=Enterobacter hormaechei TaxID=158836 RepID=UPI001953F7E5
FLTGLAANPNGPATALVSPAAARANRSVFFNEGGAPRSAPEVYDLQTRRFGGTAPVQSGTTLATTGGAPTGAQTTGPPRPAGA